MIVTIEAPGPVDCAQVKVEERSMSLTPLFYAASGKSLGPTITVKNNRGKVIYRGQLRVSGVDGSISLTRRTVAVAPVVDSGVERGDNDS